MYIVYIVYIVARKNQAFVNTNTLLKIRQIHTNVLLHIQQFFKRNYNLLVLRIDWSF